MYKKKTIAFFIAFLLGFFSMEATAQSVAIKTNILYAASAFTPNLGIEIGLSHRSTLDLTAGYNPWNLNGERNDNKKLVHWLGNVEYRYWLCEKFNGHFFGAHALASQYNISQHNLPLLFGKNSKEYRHEGWAAGAGISYGYQWILTNHWNIEATIGIGYARMEYDKYECRNCGEKLGSESRNYFGPTKAGVSFIYIIK